MKVTDERALSFAFLSSDALFSVAVLGMGEVMSGKETKILGWTSKAALLRSNVRC